MCDIVRIIYTSPPPVPRHCYGNTPRCRLAPPYQSPSTRKGVHETTNSTVRVFQCIAHFNSLPAGSLAAADEALRRYAQSVELWRETMALEGYGT